jgi:hypothetical protein
MGWGLSRFTRKQQAFVDQYILCGMNGTEAAARAGYKGNRQTLGAVSAENLRKPKIRAAIDTHMKTLTMSASEVLFRLHEHAQGIPEDCFRVYGGLIGVDFEKLQEHGLLHLIKKVSYDRDGHPVVEFYDAQSALVHLGKYHALFTDRIKHEDWRSEAIEYIRKGEIGYEALADELGIDLATELFTAAGVPIAHQAGAEKNA